MNSMKAIILAAGSGTRLEKYNKKLPKALVDVNGRSIIERQISLLQKEGITEIYVVRGYKKEKFTFHNAEFIDDDHPALTLALSSLQTERESGDLIFILNTDEFLSRSEAAVSKLIDIAQQAKKLGAFFLIIAPNDDLARWMYSQMRNAVDGYRLRGNIELANQTSIRLRISRE